MNISTVDPGGNSVEGVRVYINDKKFAITDHEGKAAGLYPAANGDVLRLDVEAPEGYSVPPNPDPGRWMVPVNYRADGRPLQIDFRAELQRPERDYILMVRAQPAGTPVLVNNEAVGKTGPGGVALVGMSGVPGLEFVATAGKASFRGTFAEDDEVYLLTTTRSGPVTDGADFVGGGRFDGIPTPRKDAVPAVAGRPTVPPADLLLPEQLTKAQILSVVKGKADAISNCMDRLPDASGTVMVSMKIEKNGRVGSASAKPPFSGTPVGNCVESTVRQFQFPQFSGDSMSVNMPFAL